MVEILRMELEYYELIHRGLYSKKEFMFLNYVLKDEIIFSLGFCFKNNHTGWGRWVEAQQKPAWLLIQLVNAKGSQGVHDPILLFLHMFELSNH